MAKNPSYEKQYNDSSRKLMEASPGYLPPTKPAKPSPGGNESEIGNRPSTDRRITKDPNTNTRRSPREWDSSGGQYRLPSKEKKVTTPPTQPAPGEKR